MSSKTESTDKSGSQLAKKKKIDSSIIVVVSDNASIEGRLPEDVLKRIEVEQGKVVIAGNVAWDTIGKRTSDRYELNVFHRLDDKMVTQLNFCKFFLKTNRKSNSIVEWRAVVRQHIAC